MKKTKWYDNGNSNKNNDKKWINKLKKRQLQK